MTKKLKWLPNYAKLPLALAVAASASTPVNAFQFDLFGADASLDTTLSAGVSWRLEDQNPVLVGTGNGGQGGTINSDDGNLNFDQGDTFSKLVKGSTDFLIEKDDYGAFFRARYWYDFELKDEGRATDSVGQQRQLNPVADKNASGAELLDAFVWKDFWINDEIPLNLRIGRQVVSWGESTFIFNGINVINPVDVGALRAPGAELKDALLPVNMIYGSLGLTDNVTIEAFVQLEFERSRITDCGTFFSTNDFVEEGCGPVFGQSAFSETLNRAGLAPGLPIQIPRLGDQEADDQDQFGIAARWYVPELNDTEFGFYFIQYHSRLPLVSGFVADNNPFFDDNPAVITTTEAFAPGTGAAFFVEFPEQIKLFGLSFNTTTPGGLSLGGEYSFKQDVPVQLNSPDLIVASLGISPDDSGNVSSPIFQDRIPDVASVDAGGNIVNVPDGIVTVADAEVAGFLGTEQPGFERLDVSQIQLTAISFIEQVLGASRLAFVGEIGATYVHDLPDQAQQRFGRFDQATFGITPDFFPDDGLTALQACEDINAIGTCNLGGFVTSFSWGYRARASLTYNNVFAGVNLTPTLAWSHDVNGHAPGPGANFIERRRSIGLTLQADYLNEYQFKIGYNAFFGTERLNPLEDRDNISVSASYSF